MKETPLCPKNCEIEQKKISLAEALKQEQQCLSKLGYMFMEAVRQNKGEFFKDDILMVELIGEIEEIRRAIGELKVDLGEPLNEEI